MAGIPRLIGQDCAVSITLGGSVLGAPVFTTAVPITAFAKSISQVTDTEKADMSALGDKRKIQRVKRAYDTFEIELLIPNTGETFANSIGEYAQVSKLVLSTLTPAVIFSGIITKHEWHATDDAQTEKLTIECDAD